jgi:hypothetical protein
MNLPQPVAVVVVVVVEAAQLLVASPLPLPQQLADLPEAVEERRKT